MSGDSDITMEMQESWERRNPESRNCPQERKGVGSGRQNTQGGERDGTRGEVAKKMERLVALHC